ncbi:hypothetical protein scyTo_0015893 [Scyliorhinus torazame]|uniref:Potassium channel domain-containing protein n=1 Tax=Scyliorhinus torazame TaxID=75743 RepID=A0A401Q0N3_SCYTO|nr:hypothetical protein [Scyliorhinus torazame]
MGIASARGCAPLHLNEDNGRLVLLALLIVAYLVCGAAVFSALERPTELQARAKWNRTVRNFADRFDIAAGDLSAFLRDYEAAIAAGIHSDTLRARWDFTGAFYFVGTVVSTIGKENSSGRLSEEGQERGVNLSECGVSQ